MDNFILLLIICAFWSAWIALAIVARRSWVHVAASAPWVLLAAGYAVNWLSDWVGTAIVAAIHAAIVAGMVRDALRRTTNTTDTTRRQ